MPTISFMSANFVARQLGYQMTGGWGQGDRATNEFFRPLETYAQRFDDMLAEIEAMGFQQVDLWLAHLNPAWATARHIAIAQQTLEKHHLTVASLAGGFGSTAEEVERTCRIAQALGTRILGGSTGLPNSDRAALVRLLEQYDLMLAIENHPEKNPAELLAKIGDGAEGRIGAAVDTGWFGTQGYDAARALRELGHHVLHVHLKDVKHVGPPHETCRFGRGVVPIQECVRALQEMNYQGAISVEHEPETYDPTPDVIADLAMLKNWLAQ